MHSSSLFRLVLTETTFIDIDKTFESDKSCASLNREKNNISGQERSMFIKQDRLFTISGYKQFSGKIDRKENV